jgi:hypothetical protein
MRGNKMELRQTYSEWCKEFEKTRDGEQFKKRLMEEAPRFFWVGLGTKVFGSWYMFDAIYRAGLSYLPKQISRKLFGVIRVDEKLDAISRQTPLGASWLWRFEIMEKRLLDLIDGMNGSIQLVEYGSGSALLCLMAMHKRPDREITLVGIDNNKNALRCLRKYARKLGLASRIKTIHDDASIYHPSYGGTNTICVVQGLIGVYFGKEVRTAFFENAAKDCGGLVIDFMKGGTELCLSSEAMGFPIAHEDEDFGLHYLTVDDVKDSVANLFFDSQIDDGEFSIIFTGSVKN